MAINGVGKTSLLVAAMRAVESERSESEGRLFVDPYARALAENEGFSLLKKQSKWPVISRPSPFGLNLSINNLKKH